MIDWGARRPSPQEHKEQAGARTDDDSGHEVINDEPVGAMHVAIEPGKRQGFPISRTRRGANIAATASRPELPIL